MGHSVYDYGPMYCCTVEMQKIFTVLQAGLNYLSFTHTPVHTHLALFHAAMCCFHLEYFTQSC